MATPDDFVALAATHVGYTETPSGSNRTKYAAEAGHANGAPWCATFIVAVARRLGIVLPSESAYTPAMANAFRAAGRFHATPQRGDIAFFDFPDSKNRIQHVGIVVTADAGTVTCIEGNTSSGSGGSQDNGGGVYRRTRPRRHVVGYGRPVFSAATAPAPAPASTPVAAPTAIYGQIYPEEALRPVDLTTHLKLSAEGNGYYDFDLDYDKVVSFWATIEDARQVIRVPDVNPQNVGGKLRLVIEEAKPNTAYGFRVWVLVP